MIADLDKSLKTLLEREIPYLGPDSIRFEAPDDQFEAPLPLGVDLFLYDVRENMELRSNEWQIERNAQGEVIQSPPPIRVDCSYLITAWAGDMENEHQVLSDVMAVLLHYPTLPADLMQGALARQTPPLPVVTLQSGRLQSMGEFWQALGGKPKAALHYTVTFSLDVFTELRAPAVLETEITIKPKRYPKSIHGTRR